MLTTAKSDYIREAFFKEGKNKISIVSPCPFAPGCCDWYEKPSRRTKERKPDGTAIALDHAVTVNKIVKRFREFTALNGLTFAVKPGEIFGLLGPNGAGKTTTTNLITGVLSPDSGAVYVLGMNPQIDVYFRNYNDDRAKNQRLYPTEILWRFYEKMEADPRLKFPPPPIRLREEYPQERIVGWFPFIGVALALLASTMAGMITVLALSQEEQLAGITADIGLAPRSLIPFLLSKLAFTLLMALLCTTLVLLALSVWTGMNMSAYIWVAWLLAGLVALFWAGLAFILSFLSGRALGSNIIVVAIGLVVFFIAGGTEPVRYSSGNLWWLIRLFPNAYAVDPLRDTVLFCTIPANWAQIILTLILFDAVSLSAGFFFAQRQLRKSLAK